MGRKKKTQAAVENQSDKTVDWHRVVVVGMAAKEGWDELTPGQYLHLKDLVKQLVGFGRQAYESNLTIAPFGDFWELKAKGGVLGRKNMRVYFKFDKGANDVVVLHTYKKEDDRQAPPHVQIRVKNRWNCYVRGDFGGSLIVYERPKSNTPKGDGEKKS